MDTLSHALIGLAVASLSGHAPSIHDPIYVATILGAQAPDFDIITQLRGNVTYLRQHRAFSHSLPGICGWSLAIALALSFFMPQAASFWQLCAWSFAGALSHILIDYFNTHGVAILWPFRKERKSCPLLNVFDPVLLLLLLAPYATRTPLQHIALTSFSLLTCYCLARCLMRLKAARWLKDHFSHLDIEQVWVMPSLKGLLFWDFVTETKGRILNGRIGAFYPVLEVRVDLPKDRHSLRTAEARKTALGEFFQIFSPFIYFEEHPDDAAQIVTIYDLRYFTDHHFVHSGTIVFGQNNAPCASYIHSLGRTSELPVAGNCHL
ncbi:MAG: metal-dependent hydrolase [Negativicutes bacterium]|nr:metal-dependent hydrolase [Negativicutes bacterium]